MGKNRALKLLAVDKSWFFGERAESVETLPEKSRFCFWQKGLR